MTGHFLDYQAVADYTGIKYAVLRRYLSQARTNRTNGTTTKSDLPEPDITIGQSPAWDQATIDEWLAGRPGKGVGGGRPPKHNA
jgi:predicted DNA-binding transcriptional regulator AlpA